MKGTVVVINKKLCTEASNKAITQPVGKENIAGGMLYQDFNTRNQNEEYS